MYSLAWLNGRAGIFLFRSVKKLKKAASIILALALLLNTLMVGAFSASAVESANVVYSEINKATAGDTVKLPISISGNTGVMGMRLDFSYNPSVFTPVSVESGEVFTGGLQDDIESSAEQGVTKVYWSGSQSTNENGVLFYISFAISSSAVGNETIGVSYSKEDTFNESFDDVVLSCSDIELTIENGSYAHYAKLECEAEAATPGENFSLVINAAENSGVDEAELEVSFNADCFSAVSAASDASLEHSVSGNVLKLSVKNIGDTKKLATVVFACGEKAQAGEYTLGVSSGTDGVICKGCSVFVSGAIGGSAVISADSVKGEYNGEITIPLKISNNKGLMGYKLHFTYNPEELTPVSVKNGEPFAGNLENNIGIYEACFDVLWNSTEPVTADGVLLNITFKVNTEKTTTSTIRLEYSQEDTFDGSYNDVVFDCRDVTVELNPAKEPEPIAEELPEIKTVKLSETKYVYNGKVKKPSVIIKDAKGNAVSAESYKLTYSKGRKNVGKYSVKVDFIGDYSGTRTLYFTIVPKGTSLASVKPKKKSAALKWKKQATQTTGYEIQYALNGKFKSPKKITAKSKVTAKTIKALKSKKKYYFRIRTYKVVNGKKYYSSWSKTKSAVIK